MTAHDKIKAEIKQYEDLIAAEGVPQDEKDFAKNKVSELKKKLEEPAKKVGRPAGRKPRSQRGSKNKMKNITVNIDGKPVPITEADCFTVMKKVAERQEAIRKAGKKYRVKPIMNKVADNIEQSVKQAAEAVTEARMENNPDAVIAGAKQIEKALDAFFAGFEKMTGKKVSADKRKQIMDILSDIKEEAKA